VPKVARNRGGRKRSASQYGGKPHGIAAARPGSRHSPGCRYRLPPISRRIRPCRRPRSGGARPMLSHRSFGRARVCEPWDVARPAANPDQQIVESWGVRQCQAAKAGSTCPYRPKMPLLPQMSGLLPRFAPRQPQRRRSSSAGTVAVPQHRPSCSPRFGSRPGCLSSHRPISATSSTSSAACRRPAPATNKCAAQAQ
jgi:hypothetical protein